MKAVFIQRLGPDSASFRYRSQMPAEYLGASVNGGEADVLIFTKPRPEDLGLAKEAKAEGITIVVDMVDDHFRHVLLGPVYADMVRLADCVIVPTENMSGRLYKYVGRHADAIIPDPYEEPVCAPHANGAARFLWFGHQVNIKDVRPIWPLIQDLDLTVVSGDLRNFPHEYFKWSPEMQTQELQRAHVVLLPTRKGVEYKSPNRLVNAIRAGCFAICQDHPSYEPFKSFAWVGDFRAGLQWTQANADHLNDLVAAGQTWIEQFAPEKVGEQWRQVLESVCHGSSSDVATNTSQALSTATDTTNEPMSAVTPSRSPSRPTLPMNSGLFTSSNTFPERTPDAPCMNGSVS